jgi:hypothetical protein
VAEREWMIKKRERIEEEKGTAAVPGRGHVQQWMLGYSVELHNSHGVRDEAFASDSSMISPTIESVMLSSAIFRKSHLRGWMKPKGKYLRDDPLFRKMEIQRANQDWEGSFVQKRAFIH